MALIINGKPHDDERLDGLDISEGKPFKTHGTHDKTCAVIHESAGDDPVAGMLRKGLGCPIVIHTDGKVTIHGDIRDVMWHAPRANYHGVGIEMTNIYTPRTGAIIPAGATIISAPWAWAPKGSAREYIVPPLVQLTACATIVDVLTSASWDGVQIPRTWNAVEDGIFPLSCSSGHWPPPAGISGHYHSEPTKGHPKTPRRADGPVVALFCYLVLEQGLRPDTAREMAMAMASKGQCKRVGGVWYADVGGV